MNVITADIGRSLVPASLQVPKDSDSDDDDDDGDDDDVVEQEIGSDFSVFFTVSAFLTSVY